MKQVTYLAFFLLLVSCKGAEEPEEIALPTKPEVGDMVLIPAGEFTMGSNKRRSGSSLIYGPEHRIDLSAYYIDAYEVTFGQWMKFATESDYSTEGNWRQFYVLGREDYPVANVTWDDAKAYCEWAGKRLPTEAEWEKAGRGSEGLVYPWGNQWDPTKSNCHEYGFQNMIEVGQIEADKSPYGVYDMMGNLSEWTADRLKPYPDCPVPGDTAFNQGFVAVRGGSYALMGASMGLWTRGGFFPKSQYGIGFRCAKDIEETEEKEEGETEAQ